MIEVCHDFAASQTTLAFYISSIFIEEFSEDISVYSHMKTRGVTAEYSAHSPGPLCHMKHESIQFRVSPS